MADQDHARLIAERVARRVKGTPGQAAPPASSAASQKNGAPVSKELSAIRAGLHDLEGKLDRIESKIVGGNQGAGSTRARVIDFVSTGPPVVSAPSISAAPANQTQSPEFVPATHSPWVRDFVGTPPAHPSLERFGVEEAAVSELVEFFESEKKCAVEPGGKPCDHCAMCSSRGF